MRPFPNVTQGRWQVSASGGAEPVWNPNGQELHYRDLDGTLWSARVRVDTTFTVTARERLVDTRRWRPFTSVCGTPYTVSPRDGRFLFRDEGATRRRGRVVFVEGFGHMLEDATRRE